MRIVLVLFLVSATSSLLAQDSLLTRRWGAEFGLNYVYANPMGGMGKIVDQGHGANLNIGGLTPNRHFAFGVEMAYVQYSRDKTNQEYNLDDGTVAPMEIIVLNSFANFTGYVRWYLVTKGLVQPYIAGKLGYSNFSTDLSVYDPDDNDHCEPVDSDILYHDGTMIGVIGAGVKLDMRTFFKKLRVGRFYFESSFNFTQGGQVQYMDSDADKHMHSGMPDADPVMTKFINTQTQIVHEHHVGYLYTSPVQMFDVQAGLSMRF
jgi:hypothetical protein